MSAEQVALGLGAGPAERAYRRALRAYPRRYRRERGEEIISTLLDAVDQGGAGAGDGAAPARADRRELAALVAGGLRRRLHPENPWWDGARWASAIMIAFVVLRSMIRVSLQASGLEPGGWVLPHGVDDLGWWWRTPMATVLAGLLALLALARSWAWPALGACAFLGGARIERLVHLDRVTVAMALVMAAVWALGPLAVAVQRRERRVRSWPRAVLLVVLPVAVGVVPPRVTAPDLLLLAAVALAALVTAPVARGLAVALAFLAALAFVSGGPAPVAWYEAGTVALVAAGWAYLLDRVLGPRLGRGRGGAAPA